MEDDKNIMIVQTSPMWTASTVISNILYGLILPDNPVIYISEYKQLNKLENNKVNIIKTHLPKIDLIINSLESKYNLFFVCSERSEPGKTFLIDPIYRNYKNVIIFNFDELSDRIYKVEDIVTNSYHRLKDFLPTNIELNERSCLERIINMNKIYETIKDNPFEYNYKFYHIHGSHRNRTKMNPVNQRNKK
jgi:hypothetical protein